MELVIARSIWTYRIMLFSTTRMLNRRHINLVVNCLNETRYYNSGDRILGYYGSYNYDGNSKESSNDYY